MPRPRTIRDEDLLAAAARVVDERGPLAFTLAEVAREARVSAGILVVRFGSKRGLLLALADTGPAAVHAAFDAAEGGPVERIHAALAALASPATPRSIASGLAFLQLDVTDAEFRERALRFFDAARGRVEALLVEAMRERELSRADPRALARALEVAYNGALLRWALRQDGASAEALRHDLDAVLAPFRRRRRGREAPSPRGRRPSSGAARGARGR